MNKGVLNSDAKQAVCFSDESPKALQGIRTGDRALAVASERQ